MIAAVEPRKWIALSVVCQELQFVRGRDKVVPCFGFILLGVAVAVWARNVVIRQHGFDSGEGELEGCLLLALFCYRGDQFWHLVAQRLQRTNDRFNGGEVNYHVLEGDLRFVVCSLTGARPDN
jgi:hypothetical protein